MRTPITMPRATGIALASTTHEGMGPCLVVEDSTTHGVFEAYVRYLLAPWLEPGQVKVLDNLSAHKGGRVRV
jgi:hypothetical protein